MALFRRAEFTDDEILEGLARGGKEEDRCLKYLYKENLPVITQFVKKNQGSAESAKDVFQEAIIEFYERAKAGTFRSEARISTFLYAVAKRNWLNKLKKAGRELPQLPPESRLPEVGESPVQPLIDQEKRAFVYELLNQLKADCRKILLLSIFEHRPMKQISELMGYRNEQIARNKKHRCMNYLKDLIMTTPHHKGILNELR